MRAKKRVSIALLVTLGAAVFLVMSGRAPVAGQAGGQAVAIDGDDIGGVVTGTQGPEAGVFVIAETRGLPTRFIRSVVTDDLGRFLVPDLPAAEYDVWVRGYGLVDSGKVKARPGKIVNLQAVAAPNARAAAQYYPALYWWSLLQLPPTSDFPGTGPSGNGISTTIKSQGEWILRAVATDGCNGCHQMASPAMRTIPASILSEVKGNTKAAWVRRVQSGQAGATMFTRLNQVGRDRMAGMYADWTDRIAAGELPATAPQRPQGLERNVVITMWDWADPKKYLHDVISTDKRNPTLNANGPILGAMEDSGDYMPVIDPKTNTASRIELVYGKDTPDTGTPPAAPSPFWGDEAIWKSHVMAHSFAVDKKNRVWVTARSRGADNPAWCQAGSDHPSAKLLPIPQNGFRQLQVYDRKTGKVEAVDTCIDWGHANFDAQERLWSSFGTNYEGWFDVNIWDKTHDVKQALGWTAFILDHNGNGKRDAYTEVNDPADPAKDRRINARFYGDTPAPDGSVWGSIQGMPGGLVRLMPGAHPPETALSEYYEVPWNNPKAKTQGYGPRGMDVDSKGVVWTALSSGHLAGFDRTKCTAPLNGPTATGQHCPEGWTLYPWPGPNYKGAVDSGAAESVYYNFADRFDTLGLGKDTEIMTGNLSESLLALVNGKMITLRVPYPMGFYSKGMDGRIDNPNGGWKGRGIFTTYATRAPFHAEGGLGNTSKLVKFQMRPAPLAK